jgi:hypothetical protein
MTREERCKLAIDIGYSYNPETGKIFGVRGKEIVGKHSEGYIKIQLPYEGKTYELKGHQFAWYYVHKECVEQLDHINAVRDDNRISNLRSITHQKNQFNKRKAKGYCWDKNSKKWRSYIGIDYKLKYLGLYNTEEDARVAYLEGKQKYHII